MSFQGLKGGDRIRFWMPNGMGIRGGRTVREWKQRAAKVQPMLVFQDHVVVNLGGQHGTPYVVDSSNYLGRAA